MFDIAPTELMLVALVALVVIGPKDLPRVLRVVGQWIGRARGMARHFRSGMDEMIRQSEIEEMERKWAEENARIMREHPTVQEAPAQPESIHEESVYDGAVHEQDASNVTQPLQSVAEGGVDGESARAAPAQASAPANSLPACEAAAPSPSLPHFSSADMAEIPAADPAPPASPTQADLSAQAELPLGPAGGRAA